MPLFIWDESYSVGIALFNSQHKELVGMINRLYDAMKEGKGKTVLNGIFNDLIAYTVTHFAAEEKLMAEHRYPGMKEHVEQHRQLTEKAKELQNKFKDGNMFVTIDTLEFLKNWLSVHIKNTDKQYGPFFNEKGVK